MQTKRLFIGIPISKELEKRLSREQEGWEVYPFFLVRPANFHVTLLFLGFIHEEEIDALCEKIEMATADITAFEMRFDGIRYTPNNESPSMLWLTGEPCEELRSLRQNLEQSLGYHVPDRKSFRPHINLARVRRTLFARLPERPDLEKKVSFVEPVSSIVLFESVSEKGRRVYEALREFPLD